MGFLEIFKEGNGQWSSMRFIMILIFLVFILVWAWVSIHSGDKDHPMVLVDVPWNVVSILGLVLTGKYLQKDKEEPSQGGSTPGAP